MARVSTVHGMPMSLRAQPAAVRLGGLSGQSPAGGPEKLAQ